MTREQFEQALHSYGDNREAGNRVWAAMGFEGLLAEYDRLAAEIATLAERLAIYQRDYPVLSADLRGAQDELARLKAVNPEEPDRRWRPKNSPPKSAPMARFAFGSRAQIPTTPTPPLMRGPRWLLNFMLTTSASPRPVMPLTRN